MIIYKKAINFWGIDNQLNLLIEEFGEVISSVAKLLRFKVGDIFNDSILNDVAKEIGDSEIMIEQLKIIFPTVINKINKRKEYVLNNLEGMIKLEELNKSRRKAK